MTGDREKVETLAIRVEGDLAYGLGGIAMERDPSITTERGDFANRLQYANFVIRRHHRNEECVLAKRGLDSVDRDETHRIHRELGRLETSPSQRATRIEYRWMLGLDGDQMAATSLGVGQPENGQIIALRRATRENDLGRTSRAQHLAESLACIFDRGFGAPTIDMGMARGVAKLLPEVGQHRFEHALVERSRRVMIEVDRPFRPRRTARSHRYSMRWDFRS